MIKPILVIISTVITEMISMHIEEYQASGDRFSRWMQKDNEFGSNPSVGPSLSCAFGVKRQLTVEVAFLQQMHSSGSVIQQARHMINKIKGMLS